MVGTGKLEGRYQSKLEMGFKQGAARRQVASWVRNSAFDSWTAEKFLLSQPTTVKFPLPCQASYRPAASPTNLWLAYDTQKNELRRNCTFGYPFRIHGSLPHSPTLSSTRDREPETSARQQRLRDNFVYVTFDLCHAIPRLDGRSNTISLLLHLTTIAIGEIGLIPLNLIAIHGSADLEVPS